MVTFLVKKENKAKSEIYYDAVDAVGAVAASRWMMSAHASLDGLSPVQAIKYGRADEVRKLVKRLAAA